MKAEAAIPKHTRPKSYFERLRLSIGVGATAILYLLLAVGCGEPSPPASADVLLVYPGATDTITNEVQTAWRVPAFALYKTINFHTADPPATVLDFYRKSLLQEGWAISGCQGETSTLTMVWEQTWNTGVYVVEVAPGLPGPRNVELRLGKHLLNITGYPARSARQEALKVDPQVYACLGVGNAKSNKPLLTAFTIAAITGILLLHIILSALVWRQQVGISLLLLLLVSIVTTGAWLVASLAIGVVELFDELPPGVYSELRVTPDYKAVADFMFYLPIASTLLFILLLVLFSCLGILLKQLFSIIRMQAFKSPESTE